MKYEIRKTAEGYVLIINREDGTRNDYRFNNKAELNRWMKLAVITYGGATTPKVLFLDDTRAGAHPYYPELGERKPEVKMEASLLVAHLIFLRDLSVVLP